MSRSDCSAIEPVFDLNIALHQLVAVFSRRYQPLAKLVVNLQLLLHQRIGLNARGFIGRHRFLRGFSVSVSRLLLTASCSSCS